MLLPNTKILCGNQERPIKEIREETVITGASGWAETAETKVTDVFVQFDYKGPLFTITTSRGACIRCSPDHACFGRLNPLGHLYQVYIMERSTIGFRVGMSQDLTKELLSLHNPKIHSAENTSEIIDKIWIVEATESLPKAIFLEKFIAYNYGIPDLPFSSKQALSELSDEMINELFNRIDTPTRGRQYLKEIWMYEEYPHITMRMAKAGLQTSNAVQFIIFGGSEKVKGKNNFSHLIRIDSSVGLSQTDQKQFKRRMGQRGLWHLEVERNDFEEAQLFVKTISCLDNLQVVKKIQLTKKAPFYILPASHLKIGMLVPVLGTGGIEEDTVKSISVAEYSGPLYDLKVHELNNYIAGDCVLMSFSEFSPNLQARSIHD